MTDHASRYAADLSLKSRQTEPVDAVSEPVPAPCHEFHDIVGLCRENTDLKRRWRHAEGRAAIAEQELQEAEAAAAARLECLLDWQASGVMPAHFDSAVAPSAGRAVLQLLQQSADEKKRAEECIHSQAERLRAQEHELKIRAELLEHVVAVRRRHGSGSAPGWMQSIRDLDALLTTRTAQLAELEQRHRDALRMEHQARMETREARNAGHREGAAWAFQHAASIARTSIQSNAMDDFERGKDDAFRTIDAQCQRDVREVEAGTFGIHEQPTLAADPGALLSREQEDISYLLEGAERLLRCPFLSEMVSDMDKEEGHSFDVGQFLAAYDNLSSLVDQVREWFGQTETVLSAPPSDPSGRESAPAKTSGIPTHVPWIRIPGGALVAGPDGFHCRGCEKTTAPGEPLSTDPRNGALRCQRCVPAAGSRSAQEGAPS